VSQAESASAVACPKCGSAQHVSPVTVLRPDDENLQRLYQGKLNKATCPQCGAEFLLESPILFRDDPNRKLIYYMPLEDPQAYAQAEAQMQAITDLLFPASADTPRPECRLTLSRRHFIEKIAIHSKGLDDRLVEYIKYQLHNRKEKPIDSIRHELLFDFSGTDAEKLAFVVFDRESGQPAAATHLPREVYDELKQAFHTSPELHAELKKLFPGFIVEVDQLL
jgi:predicted RNA-binding Zn-ribbon protein involved in translation (DUF1610 family)